MANRTFTLSEAEDLLPVIEGLLRNATDAKKKTEQFDADLQQINQKIMMHGGLLVDILAVARKRAERDKAAQAMKDALAEITATGVQVKDLDIGLLDFPCMVEGKIVLLCWKVGEQGITHWHSPEEGFAGRKLIDARIANAGRRRKTN